METLYSREVRELLHTRPWPKGFRAVVEERDVNEERYLQLVLYRDNFNSFDSESRRHIASQIKEFMEKVRGMGVPIYLEVTKGDGRA